MTLFRRIVFLLCLLVPVTLGIILFIKISAFRGFQITEYYQLITICFLFPMLAYGATTALFGFFQNRKPFGDPLRITNSLKDQKNYTPASSTAIVMPIYEEDTKLTFSRMHVIYDSLKEKFPQLKIDFYFLSDTRTQENWIKEEFAYYEICNLTNDYTRIHYRRRKTNLNGKSGNLADFCRRWGKNYQSMIVLDADSLVTAETIFRLIQLMELNPNLGIIQTASKLFLPKTIFQSLATFNQAIFTGLFSAGSNYYQINSSSYYGHNAIIRIEPFMKHCALPHLPNYGALGGKILSHDTIEATLMRKAGFDVYCAYDLEGSYEESPPNIIDSLKRDQRWCQGNLQHFWFLFSKNIPTINRIQILIGILSYLNAPIWGLYIFLSVWNYLDDSKYLSYSMLPIEFDFFKSQIYDPLYYQLFMLSFLLLFLPRILGYIDLLITKKYKEFGGFFITTFGFLIETIYSILIAPIHLVYFSIFVISTLLNKKVNWGPQNRDSDSIYTLRFTVSSFFGITLLGFTFGYITFDYSIEIFTALLPISLGWILSIPLVFITSLKNISLPNLFKTPNEIQPEIEVSALKNIESHYSFEYMIGYEYFFALVHPKYYRIHKQMQGDKKSKPKLKIEIDQSISKLVNEGPDFLDRKTLDKILSDRELLKKSHMKLWENKVNHTSNYWKKIWDRFSPSSFPLASNNRPSDQMIQ